MDLALDIEQVESRVRSLAPLVKRIAKHISASVPSAIDQDRLVQSGMMSLIDAAKRYHSGPGPDFDAYAVPRIRREMIDALRGGSPLPHGTRGRMRDVELAMERLERQKRRPPTDTEVAEALGISVDEYRALLRGAQGYQVVSYEDSEADAPATDPLQLLNDPTLRGTVVKAIDQLPDRERLVMSLYLEHQLNHAEVGAVIGISESRVSEMYTQAITRIRVAVKQHRLR